MFVLCDWMYIMYDKFIVIDVLLNLVFVCVLIGFVNFMIEGLIE